MRFAPALIAGSALLLGTSAPAVPQRAAKTDWTRTFAATGAGGFRMGNPSMERAMTTICCSIVNRPRVILIDEMSSGLAPVIVSRLMRAVRQLADDGMAVVLVEQFAALALAIGNRAYVLRRGQIVYDGDCAALARDPAHLHRLYLGDAAA